MTRRERDPEARGDSLRQLLVPLAVTLLSVGAVVGGFLLARLETAHPSPTPTRDVVERPTATPFLPTLTPLPTETPQPTEPSPTRRPTVETATPEKSPTPTPTTPPTGTPTTMPGPSPAPMHLPPPTKVCSPPASWVHYIVRRGDTLTRLARLSRTTTWALMNANCLNTTALYAGQRLYLPSVPYPTPTPMPMPTPCGPPIDWVSYHVQAGDTLYSLSRRYNVSLDILRRANCLESNAIYLGQLLWVPPVTPLPSPSATPTASVSPTPTPTSGGPTPTATAEETATLSPSATPTGTPITTEPSPTSTTAASATPSATWTVTHTPAPTETPEPSPTPTLSPTPTDTPTSTVAATAAG